MFYDRSQYRIEKNELKWKFLYENFLKVTAYIASSNNPFSLKAHKKEYLRPVYYLQSWLNALHTAYKTFYNSLKFCFCKLGCYHYLVTFGNESCCKILNTIVVQLFFFVLKVLKLYDCFCLCNMCHILKS